MNIYKYLGLEGRSSISARLLIGDNIIENYRLLNPSVASAEYLVVFDGNKWGYLVSPVLKQSCDENNDEKNDEDKEIIEVGGEHGVYCINVSNLNNKIDNAENSIDDIISFNIKSSNLRRLQLIYSPLKVLKKVI